MNQAQLIGRLTRDIEVKYTKNTQTAVVDNCLAVYRDKYNTDFINIKVIGKNAENLEVYCRKGSRIGVVGRIENDTYEKDGEKKTFFRIVADRIDFLDFKKNDDELKEEMPEPENKGFKELGEDVPF